MSESKTRMVDGVIMQTPGLPDRVVLPPGYAGVRLRRRKVHVIVGQSPRPLCGMPYLAPGWELLVWRSFDRSYVCRRCLAVLCRRQRRLLAREERDRG